jgi:arylsulfatase A-like enzyme
MTGQVIALPENEREVLPIALKHDSKFRPLDLLLSMVVLVCCSLELEVLEQVDSMTLYMTLREIFLDASAAMLILLGMVIAWWLCLLLLVMLGNLIASTNRRATSIFWRLGLAIPLSYFFIGFVKATRLRFFHQWQMGFFVWLWLGPLLVLPCVVILCRINLSTLQRFCRTRLVPIGWLHIILAATAIVAFRAEGVHVFHDFAHRENAVVASDLPDIYLITIDALRADHMSLYGYSRPTTPNLERFAQRASTFDYFFANSNFTTSATTSIETGKLPWTHRVFQLGGFLRGQAQRENLEAMLRQRGYYTSMISSNPVAGPIQHRTLGSYDAVEYPPPMHDMGSFQHYTDLVGLNTLYTLSGTLLNSLACVRLYMSDLIWNDQFPNPAEPVFDWVRHSLQPSGTHQPRFVWAHVFPPHDPYLAPLPYRGRFLSSSKLTRMYDFIGLDNRSLPRGVSVDEMRARYDEDINYTDHAVGSFLEWLDHTGRLDRSIVIISADHGESFEHGWFKHTGPYLYNDLIRIPLLVHLPGQKEGLRITQTAEQVDLLPTILDLVGGPVPSWSEGTSLKPSLEGKQVVPRSIFSMNLETSSTFEPITRGTLAVIDNDFKYIDRLRSQEVSLYRYRTDPLEQQNLVESEPAVAARMKALLADQLKEVNDRVFPKP